MAWLIERGNVWTALWTGPDGKQVRKSTRVHIKPTPKDGTVTAKQLKQLAQRVADGMEATASGNLTLDLALAAVRAAATGISTNATTLGEFSRKYLASKISQKSYNNNKTAIESLSRLLPGAEALPISKITPAMAEDYITRALDEVSGSTIDRRLEAIGAMFNRAVREKLISENPFRGLRPPKWSLNEAREREPFTREELQRILAELPGEWPDMISVCLLLGGLRLSDVANLTWAAIDSNAGLVRISHSKTNKPQTKPLIKPLRQILDRRKANSAAWSDYVFPYAQLRYAQAGNKSSKLSIEFNNLLQEHRIVPPPQEDTRRAGKARRFQPKTFHSLRTTSTTFLLDLGCPPELVRHIVGHDDPAIERAHYYKPTSTTQQNYIHKLAELLGLE